MNNTSYKDYLIPLDDDHFPVVNEDLDLISLNYEDREQNFPKEGNLSSIIPFPGQEQENPLIQNEQPSADQRFSSDMEPNGQQQLPTEGQFNEPPAEKESFAQSVASHPITQGLLGAAKYFTWPLDVLKVAMVGEGLTDLDEIEESFKRAGQPFDREDYINKVHELGESIPTQQFIEDKVKEHTGIDLAPKGVGSKIIRKGAEILTTGPKGLMKEPAKQIVKRSAGAVAGGAAAEGLKEVGANETLADILGYALGGAAGGKSKPASLTPEAKKLTETAEKHALRKFEGLQREAPPKNPVVSAEKQAKLTQELSESSRNAIDKVIEGKLPIKKLRDSGVDLKTAYTAAYDQANNTAKQLGAKNVDLSDVLDFIKTKQHKIKSSAPSLSSTDKAVLGELDKQFKQLTEAPKPQSKILGPNGQPLPQSNKRIQKQTTAEQALDQYKNFNEEVAGIYRKTQFTGSENAVKNMYEELKSEWIKSIEKTSPQLANELKFANRIFSQTANLNMSEAIMAKAFKDGYNPNKLISTLGNNKNKTMLERSIGKDAVNDLMDIATYGQKAEEKVLSLLKNPKTMGQVLSEMSPLKLGLLSIKHGLNYKLYGLPLAYDTSKGMVHRAQGALFTRPATRKSYTNYLKHSVNPESAAFKRASRELTKSIEDEYGSEGEFLKYLEELKQEEK